MHAASLDAATGVPLTLVEFPDTTIGGQNPWRKVHNAQSRPFCNSNAHEDE